MSDNCKCIDCGGDQPGHSKDCEYMAELHGDLNQATELEDAQGLDLMVRVRAVNVDPRPCYEDPLGQHGFMSVKVSVLDKSMGDWIVFTDVADEGAVRHLLQQLLMNTVAPELVKFAENNNTRRRRARFGDANG